MAKNTDARRLIVRERIELSIMLICVALFIGVLIWFGGAADPRYSATPYDQHM
jgi:hypothetical protein